VFATERGIFFVEIRLRYRHEVELSAAGHKSDEWYLSVFIPVPVTNLHSQQFSVEIQ
jgi:hypothetical protein